MSLWKGNKRIKEIFSGNKLIDAVFKGNAQVYTRRYDNAITSASSGTLLLKKGSYYIQVCGGGGAGGNYGATGCYANGGNGGAGGNGTVRTYQRTFSNDTSISYYVGRGGYTSANGGNGGSGATGYGGGGNGGNGGGGGYPSYIKIGSEYLIGEAGGGGGTNVQTRYKYGCGGGGGGGYYKLVNGTITAVNGQRGGDGGPYEGWGGSAGTNGNTSDFPNIKAGHGGFGGDWHSQYWNGAEGGSGGGAGGGGGGAGWGNSDYSFSGVGGGGAGGSWDAGGGGHGHGSWEGNQATDAYNFHTWASTVYNYQGVPVSSGYGRGGTGGIPGTSEPTNGSAGFIFIHLFEKVYFSNDYGSVTDTSISQTNDFGSVSESVSQHFNYGGI